jgi:lipopolysaccharide/colanic/teichoic acid biosynthesis glycosyltransferase
MTLVGPRPPLPSEVAEYRTPWLRRLSVKPGLSGLWQVSGRSTLPLERWMALDRLYLRRRSIGFDALILLRTIAAVVSMRGAW